MKSVPLPPLTAVALAVVSFAPTAQAQMLGQTMDGEWMFPSFGTVIEGHTFVVSSGIELPSTTIVNISSFDIDLDEDTITFNFNSSATFSAVAFNGWLFRDASGTLPQITGFTIDAFSAGLNSTFVTTGFNDDECWTNQAGMHAAGSGDWIRYKVTFAPVGPHLAISGTCPGTGSIDCSGMTPGGPVYIGYGTVVAPWAIPAGSCAGTVIQMTSPTLLFATTADGGGNVSIPGVMPQTACGAITMIAFDVSTCVDTNLVAL